VTALQRRSRERETLARMLLIENSKLKREERRRSFLVIQVKYIVRH